jgi:putative DNA methylase
MESILSQPSGKKTKASKKANDYEPPNLGKAIRLPVPNFDSLDRPPVCLEVDFPIAPINALSNLEGNAGKPIYQMSKWWARRRSSVFRSLLIAAATEAPCDPTQAAKRVWDHYYCNHQKAGTFRKLRILDIFMGGGTTLVEGVRLGMQVVGVDLNPVAWFVTKNELACSDLDQVKGLFDHIEAEVKPLVQPFYTTTCSRGHKGCWTDVETGNPVNIDPVGLLPEQRRRYRWEGPEVIYTFWAKHGPCEARGCGHRTPIFRSPIIAEKKLSTTYISATCPSCAHTFGIELGETRMAPNAERVVLDTEPSFTETTQFFARLLNDYSKGNAQEKRERVAQLLSVVDDEPGLGCPKCGVFAGNRIKATLERHIRASRVNDLKKKDFNIEKRPIYMYLLIHPDWLEGTSGFENGEELGGYASAPVNGTIAWYEMRLNRLRLIEVRGRIKIAEEEAAAVEAEEVISDDDAGELSHEEGEDASDRKKYGLPREIILTDGTCIQTRMGTVPQQSHFTCRECGRQQDVLEALRLASHTAPVAPYALQCHCLQCEKEGYNYGGRYFKSPDAYDIDRLTQAEREWSEQAEVGLADYWPHQAIPFCMAAHVEHPLPGHGYTQWWKLFNPRQLLVHTQLLQTISNAPEERWPLDVREQALGAFQQYLRNQNMFCFWDISRDCMAPHLSNANYHPKALVIENCVFHTLGRGNWQSAVQIVREGINWASHPWEAALLPESEKAKSTRVEVEDPINSGRCFTACSSSTDLSILGDELFDLVITDPPFNNRVYYADLSDFFYVWLRIPLFKWYEGMPEQEYFRPERTPHAQEAQRNPAEYPDDREEWEKDRYITKKPLGKIQGLTQDPTLTQGGTNPLFRTDPASSASFQLLTACWSEAARHLKRGGLMAFTFHHNEDDAWVDVLESLFNAGFVLCGTYPIRSDETKGERAAFGSQKIEYDIIHVCRKRLEETQPVSWSRMRRWVKDEATRLKELLEHSHGKTLPESDLLVILRGKALEFYSRHYGQVYTGEGQILCVGDALLGINQLLEDLLEGEVGADNSRSPDSAEPATRLFLRIFNSRRAMSRDELHKTLRGTGVTQVDFEARGWIRVIETTVHAMPIADRFHFFTAPGRNRKILKTDLDQAHFLLGAAQPGSGIDVTGELNRQSFSVKKSVDALLDWYARNDLDDDIRRAARLVGDLIDHWRAQPTEHAQLKQLTLFDQLEAKDV